MLKQPLRFIPTYLAISAIAAIATGQQRSGEQLIAVGWVQAAGEIRIHTHKSDLGKTLRWGHVSVER